MRICEVYIDGFGALHDTSFSDVSPGLTIIKGANEAGKSTLLVFLRRMLFGFPSRGGKDFNSYEPSNGGEHGGYLIIETKGGDRYIIERNSREKNPKILCPDGSKAGVAMHSIIGSADHVFYENVFAFGLAELQSFDTLSPQPIQDMLTSAGIGMTKTAIPEVQRLLVDKINALYYKDARQKPEIKKKLQQIVDIEKDLKNLSRSQSKYDDFFSKKDEKESRITELKGKKLKIAEEKLLSDASIMAWEDWIGYNRSSEELSSLLSPESFPEKGIDQLDGINEKITEFEGQRADLISSTYSSNESVISETVFDERIIAHTDAIREAERSLKKYVSDRDRLKELEGDLLDQKRDLNTTLRTIGKDWTENHLLSFDVSSSAKTKVEGFQVASKTQQQELLLSREHANQESQKKKTLRFEIDDLRRLIHQQPENGSPQDIENIDQALERLTSQLSEKYKKENDLQRRMEREAESAAAFKSQAAPPHVQIPTWPAAIIGFSALVCLLFGILQNALPLGVLFFIVLMAAALIYRSAVNKAALPREASDPNGSLSESQLLNLSDLRRRAESELRSFEQDMFKDAQICGFDMLPDGTDLSLKRRQVDAIKKNLMERASLEERQEKQEGLLIIAKDSYSQSLEAFWAAEETERVLQKAWMDWLDEIGLDRSISPDAALKIFNTAEQCISIQHNTKKLERLKNELHESVQLYEGSVHSLAESLGANGVGSCEGTVLKAVESLNVNEETLMRFNELDAKRKTLLTDIENLSRRIERYGEKRADLFKLGSATSEEQFRENASGWDRKQELKKIQHDSQYRLKKASDTSGKSYSEFLMHLADSDYAELVKQREVEQEAMQSTESSIGELQTELGKIKQCLSDLENDDKAALKEMDHARILEDMHEDSRAWTKFSIAQFLLRKAVERYEQERQPAVYREAQTYFANITNGKYQRLIKPIDSKDILVTDARGRKTRTNKLSRGTAEQLYLSLRFGYITEFCKHAEPLPVIFDDILVNFDPERQENACDAIARLTDITQVLFFTCHPETVEELVQKEPRATVIDL